MQVGIGVKGVMCSSVLMRTLGSLSHATPGNE